MAVREGRFWYSTLASRRFLNDSRHMIPCISESDISEGLSEQKLSEASNFPLCVYFLRLDVKPPPSVQAKWHSMLCFRLGKFSPNIKKDI